MTGVNHLTHNITIYKNELPKVHFKLERRAIKKTKQGKYATCTHSQARALAIPNKQFLRPLPEKSLLKDRMSQI